jgi:choline dehydrogenase-like flavoprotein
MKHAIVVGSGAGGATAAKELQGSYQVTILEAGAEFRPLALGLPALEGLKRSGVLLDERMIHWVFPTMQIRKTQDMVLVNGIGLGGTTTLCTGNALRMDQDLRNCGIDLDAEFAEIEREIPITTEHQKRWGPQTRRLYGICQELGLEPRPTPKMGDYRRCTRCGRCVFGCPQGAKWDSRQFLQVAQDRGAQVITGCHVEAVSVRDGRATGVWARRGLVRRLYPADLVILAAGGLGTPVILQDSGIPCEPQLFVDPVLCVATEWRDALQCREIEMPFVVQREHYILSPYFDYLSFLFNRAWKHRARDTWGLMIKLADTNQGGIGPRGVKKALTTEDRQRLEEGVALCTEVMRLFGAPKESLFLGTLNAGHPGGMLPLTAREAQSLHHDRLPPNLYVADATLLPRALGNPPILTIVALAKKVSKLCRAAA